MLSIQENDSHSPPQVNVNQLLSKIRPLTTMNNPNPFQKNEKRLFKNMNVMSGSCLSYSNYTHDTV